jgi:hypothetical protein
VECSGHLLRRARHHDHAALIAAFWTQIDHLVAAADHIEVVLDVIDGFSGGPRQSMPAKPKNYLPTGGSSSGALVCR